MLIAKFFELLKTNGEFSRNAWKWSQPISKTIVANLAFAE